MSGELDVRERIAMALHYPACWDTFAYPTLESAAWEAISCANLGCSACVSDDAMAVSDAFRMDDDGLIDENCPTARDDDGEKISEGTAENTMGLTDDVRKLIEAAADCINEAVTYKQDGFDSPFEPASKWDYDADQLAYELRALLSSAKRK